MTDPRAIIGIDYESALITIPEPYPHPVCLSVSGGEDSTWLRDALVKMSDPAEVAYAEPSDLVEGEWAILVRPHLMEFIHENRHRLVIVAHNLAFEAGVTLDRVLKDWTRTEEFGDGSYRCTQIREALWAVANATTGKGTYDWRVGRKDVPVPHSLAFVLKARFDVDLSHLKSGPDVWRLRYIELDDVKISEWPLGAQSYAIGDAFWARRAFYHQQLKDTVTEDGFSIVDEGAFWGLRDELRQTRASLAFSVMGNNGPSVDLARVALYAGEVRESVARAHERAREGGWLRSTGCKPCKGTGRVGDVPELRDCSACDGGRDPNVRAAPKSQSKKDTKRLKAWVSHAYKGDPPTTPKGNVKTSEEVLRESGLSLLVEYAKGVADEAALSRQIPLLEKAAEEGRTNCRFTPLVRSGRSSARNPNLQNPDSKGHFRSCFVAKPGNIMAAIDYSTLEMYAWAQSCLELYGVSTMAEWLNDGLDVHSMFGCHVYKAFYHEEIEYEEFIRRKKAKDPDVLKCRKFAKVPIFGCPGMLQRPQTLVSYASGMGIELSLYEAEVLIELWMELFEESPLWVRDLQNRGRGRHSTWTLEQPVSGRIRGGCTAPSGANSYFQGRSADFTKDVMWRLHLATVADTESPLYGVRMWNFIHDEFIFEGPLVSAPTWVEEAKKIMLSCTADYFPDVCKNMAVEETVSVRWDKFADIHTLDDGSIVPWEFSHLEKKGRSHLDLPAEWLVEMPQYLIDYLTENP